MVYFFLSSPELFLECYEPHGEGEATLITGTPRGLFSIPYLFGRAPLSGC